MPTWSVTVHYFRKPAVLNPEEPTTLRALHALGFTPIEHIQMGGCFILTINSPTRASAEKVARDACDKLLVNLVTSTYAIVAVMETTASRHNLIGEFTAFMAGVQNLGDPDRPEKSSETPANLNGPGSFDGDSVP
mgnify:CR=1 FL=1